MTYYSSSLVRAGVATNSSVYRVGEQVVISGLVFDGPTPIRNATVLAAVDYVDRPEADPVLLTLTDSGPLDVTPGDGIYTGSFTPDHAGDFAVAVKATGTSAANLPFARTASTDFNVTPSTARFVSFGNEGRDSDGDGLFDEVLVTASYACADGGSGAATCVGPAPVGGAVNTSTVGAHTFTVTATDAAGNAAAASVVYNVVNNPTYNVSLLYDPSRAHRVGSTIPVRIKVLDALSGQNVSSSDLVVHALGVTKESEYAPGPVEDAGNANPDDDFRFNNFEGAGGYIFNLQTTGLTTGAYVLVFKVGNDSFTYGARFQVK